MTGFDKKGERIRHRSRGLRQVVKVVSGFFYRQGNMSYTLVLINRIMNPYVVLFCIKFGEPAMAGSGYKVKPLQAVFWQILDLRLFVI